MRTLAETRAFFENDAFATKLCGITIEEATTAYARCRMPLTEGHLNAMNVAQGGAVFTLCDTAFGVAANADGATTVSLGANITFVRPGSGAYLVAEARCVASTRSTCLYHVEVLDEKGKVVAFATVNGFRKRG